MYYFNNYRPSAYYAISFTGIDDLQQKQWINGVLIIKRLTDRSMIRVDLWIRTEVPLSMQKIMK